MVDRSTSSTRISPGIDIQVPLKAFTKADSRVKLVSNRKGLRISMLHQKYAYGAVLDLARFKLPRAALIRIFARTGKGVASFGVTDPLETDFLVEKQLVPDTDFSEIELPLSDARKAGKLVVRTFAKDGISTSVEIARVEINESEHLTFAQRYGVGGKVRTPVDRMIDLRIRSREPLATMGKEDLSLADIAHPYITRPLDLSKTVLFLVDTWKHHPVISFKKRVTQNLIDSVVPLLELARGHCLRTLFLPHAHAMSDLVAPTPGDIVVFGGTDYTAYEQTYYQQLTDLLEWLHTNRISHILYAGYATDRCLLHRPAGLIKMAHRGFDCIILKDCTLSIETTQSQKGEWLKYAMIHMIEDQFGGSTTLEDFKKALLG